MLLLAGVGPFPQAKAGANSTHEPTAYTRVHTQSHVHERKALYGSVSKPCTPGEHQNSW